MAQSSQRLKECLASSVDYVLLTAGSSQQAYWQENSEPEMLYVFMERLAS